MPLDINIWTLVVTAILGLLTSVAGVYATRSGRKANVESAYISGYDALIKNLQTESAEHRTEIAKCNLRIREQSGRITRLERREEEFIRWGRAVIRWHEAVLPFLKAEETPPFPKPPPGIEAIDTDSGDL